MATNEGILLGAARLPAPSPVPREIVETRAIEAVDTVVPPRFPRAEAMLEALTLADRCRVAASTLDSLAAHAANYEPASFKRRAHGIVRALFAELEGRVAL